MKALLKRCPFCGSGDVQIWDRRCKNSDQVYYAGSCRYCGAKSMLNYKSKKEAVEAWNERVIEDELEKELHELANRLQVKDLEVDAILKSFPALKEKWLSEAKAVQP